MEAPLHFSLAGKDGKELTAADGIATITTDALGITPKGAEAQWYSLRDIVDVSGADYRVHVSLASGESLALSNLGYRYEDFVRCLHKARNELELSDLLMQERVRKQGVKAAYRHLDRSGRETAGGKGEVRLYDSALVFFPEGAQLVRFRYSEVASVEAENLALRISAEGGERLELTMMGKELEPTRKAIADAVAELSARTQAMLKDAYPDADGRMIAQAAKLMKDGRAAKKADIEAACPGLWSALENKIAGYDMEAEYRLLSSLSDQERMRIGMKRSLVPGEEEQGKLGEYVFFFAPVYSLDDGKGGNAIAFEAASGEGEGRATYFFRILERGSYKEVKDTEELDQAAERFMDEIGKALIAINFRREPIYLPDAKLYAPENSRYRHALVRIPELRELREHFIGRVIHSDPVQWASDVSDLLIFNVKTSDARARWAKDGEE